MNVVGIIAEYNPFHNGHAYHVAKARKQSEARFVIACMSGNYTQRGEPALFDKWTRTRMALASGVDLVIEIPALYSLSSSEFYAEAGVRLLSHTGQVSHLSFGIEPVLPEKELLDTLNRLVCAETDEADTFSQLIQKRSKEGHGYAVQRAAALHEMTGVSESLLQSPNLILALDYLKALYRLESSIVPVPVLRNGDYHTSDDAAAPSASVLREKFNSGASIEKQVPPEVFAILQKIPAASSLDTWSDLLFDRALHLDAAQLSQMSDVSEGLESRILRILDHPIPVSEAVEAISTKRYPKARIRRILMNLLLEAPVRPDAARRDPGYLRILGFRKEAEPLLSAITEAADVPVITNLSRQLSSLPEDLQSLLRFEAKATDLYFAHVPDTHIRRGAELTQPIIVK